MKQDLLKRFLVTLPSRLNFDNQEAIRVNLFKALYYGVTNDGQFLEELFPSITSYEKLELTDYEFPICFSDQASFFSYVHSESYSHPIGSACARPLKKGEPVYRCEECGFDSSCVLCVYCFNENDHIGHNVQMYVARESTNGICDCGDHEAFKHPLKCKCQIIGDTSEITHPFKASLKTTLRIVLDYILDVTNFSIATLPFIHDHINKGHGVLTTETLSEISSLPVHKYGAEDKNSTGLWYLVVWNDEHHNFPEATEAISAATGVDHLKAHEIASKINIEGRCVLKSASSPISLFQSLDTAETNGLVATIMSARDYLREQIVEAMVQWLQEILSHASNSSFKQFARRILGELLLEDDYTFPRSLPVTFLEGLSVDVRRKCYENGILYGGSFVNDGLTTIPPDFSTKSLNRSIHMILTPSTEKMVNSRLQFLLVFTIRFKSVVRRALSQILIPPVLLDSTMKSMFCHQYVQIYPQLLTCLALVDREDHLSCIYDISSQIMTCPTSVQYILTTNHMGHIVGPLAQLIEEHVGKWDYDSGYPTFHEQSHIAPAKMKSLYEAVLRGVHDVNYVLDKNLSSSIVYHLLEKPNLAMVLLLLRTFQGYWTIERKYGDHVEKEIYDFIVHLKYSVPVLKIAKYIAEADTNDVELVKSASKVLLNYLNMRRVEQKSPGVANFTVSKDRVSFVHPINSLLSYLLQAHDFTLFLDILQGLKVPFMTISDISLRSIVLGAQVKVGFWIRNGISVSRQATLYAETAMADLAYWRDVHLNQIAIVVDDPQTTLSNFLDRWELFAWFTGEVTHSTTVYEDRFFAMAEKFLLFIHNLVCDRSCFMNLTKSQRLAMVARKSISYALSTGPKSYSTIKSTMDSEIEAHDQFDTWLLEVADYQPPSSLVDSGMYRLKPHIYGELDPFSIRLDSSQAQDVMDAIVNYVSTTNNIKHQDVNLVPHIVYAHHSFVDSRITQFCRTVDFAKLVYKFLQVSIDTKDETYLPHLLHLIHAVLLDDGTVIIPESFVTIPISDLLLNIVESTMSKHVVNKASFLLQEFITKDPRVVESLVDCFGKHHVDAYMDKKTGLVESDTDRRKRLASQRTAKVMKKFAKQRKKFLDKNSDSQLDSQLDLRPDSPLDSDHHHPELRHCVVCNEPESCDEVFGLLGSTFNTSILWKLNEDDPVLFQAALARYHDPPRDPHQACGRGYKYSTNQTPLNNLGYDAFVASTCSHGMHYRCYRNIASRSTYFACPLCHTIQNIFIPSFMAPSGGGAQGGDGTGGGGHGAAGSGHGAGGDNAGGGGVAAADMDYPPLEVKYNQILHSTSTRKATMLMQAFFHSSYTESSMLRLRKNVHVFSDDFNMKLRKGDFVNGTSPTIKYFNVLQKLSTLIADTIRMHEITARLDGADGYSQFLHIPAASTTLLKSLIQCRVALYELREMPSLLGSTNNLATVIKNFWNSEYLVDGVFNEVVMLYFQTDESLTTLARLGLTKIVTVCFYSLALRCRDNQNFGLMADVVHQPLDSTTISDVQKIFDYGKDSLGIDYIDDCDRDVYFTTLYYGVERCILPYLRQMVMFADILTSLALGDHTHRSTAEMLALEHEIKAQDRLDNPDILCTKLGIPILSELIHGLAEYDESREFEFKIHDIVLQAKIPKYYDSGILTIDYPGVIRLIDLPSDFMTCMMDYNRRTKNGVYDNYICLHCGLKLPISKFYRHMRRCSSHTCIFFHASKNNLRVVTHIGGGPISVHIPGPYLTVHGEVKDPRTNGKAMLSQFRYMDLNRLWLNQTLFGFLTRSLYGRPGETPFGNMPFATGLADNTDDDDDDYMYSPFAW